MHEDDKTNETLFACGCIISLFSSAYVIITFALKKQRRRHPAALMASRSVCDLCLAVLWLGMTFASTPLDCSSVAGQSAAFFTEFFVIASELLLACLSYDVLVHADDPFVDYKRNLIKYFTFSSTIALCFAIGLVVDVDGVGESFLPICWTCYRGGRVISYSNVSMALFFYIPWSLCFLLTCAAMGRASIVLDLASKREGDARTSALRDSRRVILFHATYWGLLLAVFGPLTNHESSNNTEEEDMLEHTLRGVVWFLTGARAVENAAVWMSSSNSAPKRGQAELSPILNIEMQREILNAAMRGMSELLLGLGNDQTATAVHEYIVAPQQQQQFTVQNAKTSTLEKWYVLYSVLPILLACAVCGLVAIVDDNEPSYVSVVFLALFCAIALVLLISSQWGSSTDRGKVLFASLGEAEGLRELRDIWSTPAETVAAALQQCQVGHTRFSISAGKSGAFMFFTPNNRFVVKTIPFSEMHTLCTRILPKLPAHAAGGASSLAKVFACFEMTFCYVNQRTVYLIVMENVLLAPTQQNGGVVATGTRYDLKGSWLQRTQTVPKAHTMCICQLCHRAYEYNSARDCVCLLAANQGPHRPRMLFKDNDFRERIMGNSRATKLIRVQLSRDVLFLSSLGLMDYSLLISIHRKLTMLFNATKDNNTEVLTRRTLVASLIESPHALQYGIVDWFTEYSWGKQMEFLIKYYGRCMWERDTNGFLGFSSVDPVQYRDRFMLRVVDLVFPLLNHIVQVVDSNETTCTALDVTGVTSLAELQRLVASVSGPINLDGDYLVCFHADCDAIVITEQNFTMFLHRVQAYELCTLLIVRKQDAMALMNLY